tara:strand:+ start:1055 stop:1471 length:417 start_codon:yes stop_codon:yes gene_type:complete
MGKTIFLRRRRKSRRDIDAPFRQGETIIIPRDTPWWRSRPNLVRRPEQEHRKRVKLRESSPDAKHRGSPVHCAQKTYKVRVARVWRPRAKYTMKGAEDWWVGWRSGANLKWTRAKYLQAVPSAEEMLAAIAHEEGWTD